MAKRKKDIEMKEIKEEKQDIVVNHSFDNSIIETDINESQILQKEGYQVFEIKQINGKTIHKLKRVSVG